MFAKFDKKTSQSKSKGREMGKGSSHIQTPYQSANRTKTQCERGEKIIMGC